MRDKKRNVLLRPPALVVMVAMLLAVSGVVYTHWTTSLNLNGNVNTGGIGVGWFDAWTNDDGMLNDGDGEPTTFEVYDAWGDGSSADPSSDWKSDSNRYNKDVAGCFAWADGGSNLNLQIEGAYPSYHCALTALVGGQGNVPVRATSLSMTAWKGFCGAFYVGTEEEYTGDFLNYDEGGPYIDANENGVFDDGDTRLEDNCVGIALDVRPGTDEGNFEFGMPGGPAEIEGDISAGIRCGTQIDPVPCHMERTDNPGVPYDGPQVGDGIGGWWVDDGPDGPDGTYDPGFDTVELIQVCDESGLMETSGWIHVLQPAYQNANYSWNLSQEYVNWNEWDVTMCTPGSWVDQDGDPTTSDLCLWNGSTCET